MHSFCPLQSCLSVLHMPLPLQSFLPLQDALSVGLAGVADFASGVAGADFASGAAGVDGVLGVAEDGSAGGFGASPPQPVAPIMSPPTAATSKECAIFMFKPSSPD